ncbi:MAG TPA: hypothetical protein VHC21_02420 [Candidatus Saccharimonadales bacterium]|nr:hypothetical protein [Candidatus Saccharimonadales bacterium]
MSSGESKSSENTLRQKSAEADIPLRTYLRGYRANLRARTLALGVACVLGGGVLAAETAGSATAADPLPAHCADLSPVSQETCQQPQNQSPDHEDAVVAMLLGTCLVGGGSMLCAIAGSPDAARPAPAAEPS